MPEPEASPRAYPRRYEERPNRNGKRRLLPPPPPPLGDLEERHERDAPTTKSLPPKPEVEPKPKIRIRKKKVPERLKAAICATYFCNAFVLTLPVILLPMVAAEQAGGASVSSYVAAVASISTLGGAFGKFFNGFVCQNFGGRASSSFYMMGMSVCALLLSAMHTNVGLVLAAMEFFASVQWTACSVLLSNHYENDNAGFAAGITFLSLSSTVGTLTAKMGGTALLQRLGWRTVAKLGGCVAMVGAVVMGMVVTELPEGKPAPKKPFQLGSIMQSLEAVLGNRLFWVVGVAHAMAFLARTSDRVLGTFFQEVTSLSSSVCGGLTASVTLGFVHGLANGRHFHSMENTTQKEGMLKERYTSAALSALVLALCANQGFGVLLGSPGLLAVLVALASGMMASSLSFQFYQIPPMVASLFGENKAVCLSFLDGIGFLLVAPIWATMGGVVTNPSFGAHGWSVAWGLLAGLFGMGGVLMLKGLHPVLEKQSTRVK